MNQGKLEVKHYTSESQVVDIFTNGLKERFFTLRQKLGIVQFDN